MFMVVTGGSGSGKSAFAEEQIVSLGGNSRIYIATMIPFGEESQCRIDRHRKMRQGKGFVTAECYTGLSGLAVPEGSDVLLECMSNLTANEMFQPDGAGENTVSEVLLGIQNLRKQCRNLIVVTNEIFSDACPYEEETREYQKYLGEINQAMARAADQVVEVVYGIPVYQKK
ncbi:MAG: bifunctional adenosylcobinamide kinase/adenosylcobinamide-phosphate guanylyltransferase [Blautia sp.]|nr:bifunctional adenosylcobinamide kinase/adenosylcobinamide-phosphate guanylyltransferase [Blautia sp.]MDY5032019.1 bifunctional adenosylcobinamide kinase/adenosylcobinamide-phosphate guanylyltransferase [Blautia sp.]